MKKYDAIAIGTGSAMNIIDPMFQQNPNMKVAVVDKDDPGGICLTRGCIPSKLLLYPAELIRTIEKAKEFGIDVKINSVNYEYVMERMRTLIYKDINMIRKGLSNSKNIDYYPTTAEFIAPYTLKVDDETIRSNLIFICSGSRPIIPGIEGLEKVGYHTSDSILKTSQLPKSIAIVGGGFIAAEYGHFLSAMGSNVTIIGRNPRFLPGEEPEVSALARRELGKHMKILTNHEVRKAEKVSKDKKRLVAIDREGKKEKRITSDEILIAAGRGSNSRILRPERGGIDTDERGWIIVDDYMQTSQPNIWAFGDANGKYLFKHVANYESIVAYYNAVLKKSVKIDYHAIPHAVFMYPEIASVGMREEEAIVQYGKDSVLIGIQRYQDTAKGEAMNAENYFVKAIVDRNTMRILGAHIIGPYASILIHEIINLMYTPEQSSMPIIQGMHIHPALNEVVERAFRSLMPVDQYHYQIEHQLKLQVD